MRSVDKEAVLQRRRVLRAGSLALAALATLSFGRGSHAARGGALGIVCSGPAGSIPDLIARAVGEQLSVTPGQPALIDNCPGAAGLLSVSTLKSAPAGASTLLLAQGAIATVYPYLYTKLSDDPDLDLQPVSMAAEMTMRLAIGPAVPVQVVTLADFIDWLRRHPAASNVGSPGTGTLPHHVEAMLFREAGVAWKHIAYSGGPPVMTDLLGEQIAALVLPEGLLQQHHAAHRVRVIATSGAQRSAYLPDVPTFVEQGYPNLLVKEWFAFFAPGGTAKDTVESLSAALQEAIARPTLSATFAKSGMTAASSSPATLSALISAEQRYWKPLLHAHGIRADS